MQRCVDSWQSLVTLCITSHHVTCVKQRKREARVGTTHPSSSARALGRPCTTTIPSSMLVTSPACLSSAPGGSVSSGSGTTCSGRPRSACRLGGGPPASPPSSSSAALRGSGNSGKTGGYTSVCLGRCTSCSDDSPLYSSTSFDACNTQCAALPHHTLSCAIITRNGANKQQGAWRGVGGLPTVVCEKDIHYYFAANVNQ